MKFEQGRWTLPLLITILIVMGVQNFFLVRKNENYLKQIKKLSADVDRLTLLTPGDSLHAFAALSEDSSYIVIDPGKGIHKKLLLVFTTWCHACLKNIDQWNQLAGEVSSATVEVIGLCPDSLGKLKAYKDQNNLQWPVFSLVPDSSTLRKYKFTSFPQTILLDSNGVVQGLWGGTLSDDTRREIVGHTQEMSSVKPAKSMTAERVRSTE